MESVDSSGPLGRPRLHVGIDLGTTFSGVTYSATRPDGTSTEPRTVSWTSPDDPLTKIPKAPTVISRSPEGELFGPEKPQELGCAVFRGFKLGLAEAEDVPYEIRTSTHFEPMMEQYQGGGLAVQVTADYLQYTWKRLLRDCSEQSLCDVENHDVLLSYTVPMAWSSKIRDKLLEATAASRILEGHPKTEVEFLPEPEAAVLAHQPDIAGLGALEVGDTVVVSDAGGGTVDCVTYQVTHISPIGLQEFNFGSSDLGGALVVDDKFMKRLKEKMTGIVRDSELKRLEPQDYEKLAKNSWDPKKFGFDGTGVLKVRLPPGWRRSNGPASIDFDCHELVDVFCSAKAVTRAIDREVRFSKLKTGKHPRAVLLVGGFGRNPYLRMEVAKMCESDSRAIELMHFTGTEGWSAVSRGAERRSFFRSQPSNAAPWVQFEPLDADYFVKDPLDGSETPIAHKGKRFGHKLFPAKALLRMFESAPKQSLKIIRKVGGIMISDSTILLKFDKHFEFLQELGLSEVNSAVKFILRAVGLKVVIEASIGKLSHTFESPILRALGLGT